MEQKKTGGKLHIPPAHLFLTAITLLFDVESLPSVNVIHDQFVL